MNEYFEWLMGIVTSGTFNRRKRYSRLLRALFDTDFEWIMAIDENRAIDGDNLRKEYHSNLVMWGDIRKANMFNAVASDKECSIFEMMLALAIRMSDITVDADHDSRICEWFWDMVNSLGLGDMDDAGFNENKVNDILHRFLHREYSPEGEGGLFFIEKPYKDLRTVDIWYQMNWYLDRYFDV